MKISTSALSAVAFGYLTVSAFAGETHSAPTPAASPTPTGAAILSKEETEKREPAPVGSSKTGMPDKMTPTTTEVKATNEKPSTAMNAPDTDATPSSKKSGDSDAKPVTKVETDTPNVKTQPASPGDASEPKTDKVKTGSGDAKVGAAAETTETKTSGM